MTIIIVITIVVVIVPILVIMKIVVTCVLRTAFIGNRATTAVTIIIILLLLFLIILIIIICEYPDLHAAPLPLADWSVPSCDQLAERKRGVKTTARQGPPATQSPKMCQVIQIAYSPHPITVIHRILIDDIIQLQLEYSRSVIGLGT